ncbi:hypothetical protein HK103_003541 [Boothiomyces macroporosus]|uniref:Uncharacterized protein n=1 Tax=Boothiomyces macroporosus TaxID=261099 RepID=A0AAD5U8P1_9FUNG|nr:hypothetical protein HK103_003541 [Boothiomyces macroporosus]
MNQNTIYTNNYFKEKYKTIEIVGLNHGSDGRMCGLHPTNCGTQVQVGMHLKLHKRTVDIPVITKVAVQDLPAKRTRGRPKKVETDNAEHCEIRKEDTFKAYVWTGAVEGCCVGMVSKAFQAVYGNILDGRVVEVMDLAALSNIESMRSRDRELNGLAFCIMIA